MSNAKLSYVILYVDDIERAVAFYSEVFGLREKSRHGTQYAEVDAGGVTLGFAERKFVAEHLGGEVGRPNGASEIALVVPAASVGKYCKGAVAAGGTLVLEPRRQPWGQLVSYVRDRDGHLVEICSAVEP